MKDYRFILPNIQKKLIGTQGEQARFIPYRLEEDLTPEAILKELRRQPHMAQLVQKLDAGRRVYLLEGPDAEQLFLAAEYIGTWHRLKNEMDECYAAVNDEDGDPDMEGRWRDGDTNFREFDFGRNLPFLAANEVREFYFPNEGFGFGNSLYRPELTPQKRPWWTLSQDAPIVLSLTDPDSAFCPVESLSGLPRLVENMRSRALLIVLFECPRPDQEWKMKLEFFSPDATMEDVGFELETDCIRLGAPDQESRYKQEVLRQLAREKGTPLVPKANTEKILSLIEERRGNVSNRTIAKAVSNALLRRKTKGPLRGRDFDFLSSVFPGQRQKRQESAPELVGQPEIRRQLTRVVDSMAFQKRRKAHCLPCSPIHYTFAFLGAPGTGKTSWARWLAGEMETRGLLSGSSTICINAAELKAKYVGHTTGKVKALFEQYNAIILDEAYSLAEGEGDDCFAREALAQLCVELEDHAEDRLVIFAGYGGSRDPGDNRMLRFLQSNPGINSRVSFKISFQDFQARDLAEVLRSMLEWEHYVLPPETAAAAEDFFRRRLKSPAFGNCREARNLADRVKLRLAARLAGREDCPKGELSRVLPQDVEGAAAEILEEYRTLERDRGRAIGFSGGMTGENKI
ncbi:MAG: AAA family ATPase [Oscillospiraceae bacterium]|nr:AAA family ATPase [Oscillospiraceae bacterium]